MVLITHEMPLDILIKEGKNINDYSYALLHKCMEDDEYVKAITNGHDKTGILYLDNSCFELGASLDDHLLYEYYLKLKPDVLILPDVLGNKDETIKRTLEFLKKHPDVIGKAMAVAQGSSRTEIIECYKVFRDYRDPETGMPIEVLGIPFVFSWQIKKPYLQAIERILLLTELDHVVDVNRKHHLLGTWAAFEFAYYFNYSWIYSIDTSNPVMAAIDGTAYTEKGLIEKPKSTFDSTFNMKISDIDKDLLYYNTKLFRDIVENR